MVAFNINPANSEAANQAASAPDMGASADQVDALQNNDAVDKPGLRKRAENLASEIGEIESVKELKALPSLAKATNVGKGIFSKLLWAGGFVGATVSVLSYFLINSKILGLIFGIPTLLSFYAAHHIGKNSTKATEAYKQSPSELIEDSIANPENLETKNKEILLAIDELIDEGRTESNVELLDRFRMMVSAKIDQLKQRDDDEYSLALSKEMDRYLVALESIPHTDDALHGRMLAA